MIAKSIAWSMMAEFLPRIISPLTFIIVARNITPHDYGLVSSAILVVAFFRNFWETSISKLIVQENKDINNVLNCCFQISMKIAVVESVLLYVFSKIISNLLFNDTDVSFLIISLIPQIIIGSLTVVQMGLLQKKMKFNIIFWVQLINAGSTFIIVLVYSFYTLNYKILIFGIVVGQMLGAIYIWLKVKWKPINIFSRKKIGIKNSRILLWGYADGILSWAYTWLDSLLVALFLSITTLGLYRTGSMVVIMGFGMIVYPLSPVFYSYYSKNILEYDAMREAHFITHVQAAIFSIALPLGIAFIFFGNDINVIIGDKWSGIGKIIGSLGLANAINWLTAINTDVYRAQGRQNLQTKIQILKFSYHLPAYYLAIVYSLDLFLLVRIIISIIDVTFDIYLQKIYIKISIRNALKAYFPIIYSAIPYILLILLLKAAYNSSSNIIILLIEVMLYLILVIMSYFIISKRNHLIKSMISKLKIRFYKTT
ncbi:oligosaccharide flippase family protein [Polynucleobacter sp. MWH-S4W17]|uniref:oligosaccharide flippase family protein n=1 Tax=Polynucleobacter sp. MWH-S4W17 TaxID=1855910 RepID=UPI001BFED468|nr:oligosaccharide flippase family protein [Polynucleobacter sp. MWH-S4W17]QWD81929.1 oligosaccharide flippase family protein [Polynucleobacter sp. MWH-S4W17]